MAGDYNPTEHVLQRLQDGGYRTQRAPGGWTAQCPAHDDRNPSMSLGSGKDGRALIHCHAGCSIVDILNALELPTGAIFTDWDPYKTSSGTITSLRAWRQAKAKTPKPQSPYRREKTDHWDYHDAQGVHVARVVRYQLVDPDTGEIVGKTFTQHAWDAEHNRQQPNLGGMDVPLYRLPQVRAAISAGQLVMVCEGERDADTATAAGYVGTTAAMGAGSWRPHHTAQLAGAGLIVVMADDDDPGRAHAATVAASLTAAGIKATIRLPAEGCKDLTAHIDAGHTLGDLRAWEPDDAAAEPEPEPELDDHQAVRDYFPALDWHALWADESEEEWIVEPLLPARRLVALYSPPKVGKSLLMIELACAISCGTEILGVTPTRPYRVLYVDFENDPKVDTRDRLKAMGYGPHDLGNLVVLSFPTMSALDTAAGSEELLAAAAAYECEVIVIDTVSRAIRGEENENDTWLNFYRHTGLAVKQAGLALIRLDHTGKDETKGQRGGSAKSGDVDAVWRLSKVTDTTFRLDCEAARLPITEKTLVIHREVSPKLRHRVDSGGARAAWDSKVDALVGLLDDNEIPDDASAPEVRKWKGDHGYRASNDVIAAAVKIRKGRVQSWQTEF